jgi:hypothetical protein
MIALRLSAGTMLSGCSVSVHTSIRGGGDEVSPVGDVKQPNLSRLVGKGGSRETVPMKSRWASLVVISLLFFGVPGKAFGDAALYQPEKADFGCPIPTPLAYGKGDCNAYFTWVQRFYRGFLLSEGWTEYARRLLSKVATNIRPGLTVKMNILGRIISGEWAKENGYRRIHTYRPRPGELDNPAQGRGYPNMQDLQQRFDETLSNETGNGKAIEELLDDAQRVAEKAIRGERLSDNEKVWRR